MGVCSGPPELSAIIASLDVGMSEPSEVHPARLFEFVSSPGLVVLFLSFHPAHRFNQALPRHFRAADGSEIAWGRVGLIELVASGGAAIGFLKRGLFECGVSMPLDVLPGYYLFEGGQMLAWDSGLASKADVDAIVGASLLGLLGYALTRKLVLVGKAARMGAQEAVAARVGARFSRVAAEPRRAPGNGSGYSAPPPDPATELANAYRLLEVDPSASDREIQLAWRKLQAKLHPDHAMHDPVEFERRSRLIAELNRARDVIRAHRAGYGWRERRASA